MKPILAIGISAVLVGCTDEHNSPSSGVIAGEALFRENCSKCHPRTGSCDYLKRIPGILLTRKSQHELMKWLRGSGQHREMPNFEKLTDTEGAALDDYLHSQTKTKLYI